MCRVAPPCLPSLAPTPLPSGSQSSSSSPGSSSKIDAAKLFAINTAVLDLSSQPNTVPTTGSSLASQAPGGPPPSVPAGTGLPPSAPASTVTAPGGAAVSPASAFWVAFSPQEARVQERPPLRPPHLHSLLQGQEKGLQPGHLLHQLPRLLLLQAACCPAWGH